jgi:RNA polymerase sigma-70 factor (ECF subfamily)
MTSMVHAQPGLTRLLSSLPAGMRSREDSTVARPSQAGDAWSDEALVEAIVKRGSQRHFAALMARYKQKVHHIALSVLGPSRHAEAEDVAQEVFVKLYQRLDSFKGDSRFSTWLYRIAFNTCIDHVRREAKHDTLDLDSIVEPESGDDAASLTEHRERSMRVVIAVASLPGTQRTMVHLHYWLGFKTREIAEVMGCPEGTVKVYLQRARKRLAGSLGEMLDEG